MRYDLLYILPLKGEEEPATETKEKIGALLKNIQATIIREEDPGKRKLAYPIGRARYGFYGNIIFEAESAHMPQLKDALNLETGIIRYQIVQEEQTAPRKQKTARTKPKRAAATAVPAPVATPATEPVKSSGEKVSLEELDKKLEELLSDEVDS